MVIPSKSKVNVSVKINSLASKIEILSINKVVGICVHKLLTEAPETFDPAIVDILNELFNIMLPPPLKLPHLHHQLTPHE